MTPRGYALCGIGKAEAEEIELRMHFRRQIARKAQLRKKQEAKELASRLAVAPKAASTLTKVAPKVAVTPRAVPKVALTPTQRAEARFRQLASGVGKATDVASFQRLAEVSFKPFATPDQPIAKSVDQQAADAIWDRVRSRSQ